MPVTWTGSFTLESQCCEDPANYPDYPCYPHIQCIYWELPETTIGPIDFLLEPFVNSGIGDECAWRGTACFAIDVNKCIICDCADVETDVLWVCVKLELYCVGNVQTATLSVHYTYGETCECHIGTVGANWSVSFQRTFNQLCDPYCPDEFACNDEWAVLSFGGSPGPVYGGGTNNCNVWSGPAGNIPPLATIDYGTLVWKLGC